MAAAPINVPIIRNPTLLRNLGAYLEPLTVA